MANENAIAAGDVAVSLNHPTIGTIDLGDNMSEDAVTVEQTFSYNRQRGHDTGDVARKIRIRGLPVVQVRIRIQEMRDDILALIYSIAAPVSSGVELDEDHANKELPNLGDLTIHPVEMGSDTTLDTVVCNVRCVPESLTWPFNNQDGSVHYDSELIFEGVVEAGEKMLKVGTSTDTTAPSVSSTDPTDGASGIAITKVVDVVFSEDMNENDVKDLRNVVLMRGDTGVEIASVTLTYQSSTKTLSIGHADFPAATKIILVVSRRVRDLAGNQMAANKVIDFTTS